MIGERIRTLREANDILLRQLAAKLDMDQALLSKMERGERSFRKEDIDALAKIFKQSKKELLTLWLADKILKTVGSEKFSKEALRLAIENV
ncbi:MULTISPECIES: helix-turn-helix domain-containing protein [Flavobacteriaceae]|uniref:Helix-turn-helix domain protein n=1 Tax=Cellulophaga lytica (strain ATCC 23178 / DSM 7489 / JCM 8516 / NBRC 14961 / NCIMB 1423 / VKM B-1433 / Cy l20) TaxID=867900 RepID=F0RGZ5_CELLC|nr:MULTISPECIES: helix-turn-helix transcriptional regulator [Flavobacteriaceae]ADY30199.1 helix-turn-helix domain protein [Cellulophaga lytica DSM 7489]AIM61193.1 XRE family transcriptional regulator [Cellulophaga lytica]UAB74525.1 helix-turn-helix transcriptional regulator [Mesoflavibacter sp. SCSIO 43206]WQG78865.1 helix-turn-helix transcriptional regulator [Cellulophaga lytica]